MKITQLIVLISLLLSIPVSAGVFDDTRYVEDPAPILATSAEVYEGYLGLTVSEQATVFENVCGWEKEKLQQAYVTKKDADSEAGGYFLGGLFAGALFGGVFVGLSGVLLRQRPSEEEVSAIT